MGNTTRFSLEFDDRSDDEERSACPTDVRRFLAVRLVEDNLPKTVLGQLAQGTPLAIVIEVPSSDWVASIAFGVGRVIDCNDFEVVARDGSSKWEHVPSKGNDEVAKALTTKAVIGISATPNAQLPSTLTLVADHRFRIEFGNGRVLRDLLRRFASGHARGVSDALLRSLTPYEIESAFRAGSSAAQIVARLTSIGATKRSSSTLPDAPRLDDLHGFGTAKVWGNELVERFAAWRSGRLPWSRVASSIVLVGPPGVGKTLFGRSIAATLAVPLVTSSVGEWFAKSEGHLGDVVKSITRMFERARSLAPCVLLIDELDAVPSRNDLSSNNREWWTPVVTHLLTLLDGTVTDRTGIVVIATTNHGDRLDPALIRSGRLETVVEIDRPEAWDLAAITRLHSDDDLASASDDDLVGLMATTTHATGADAVRWVREARELARTRGGRMTFEDLSAVVLPKEERSEVDLMVISVHEAGHAIVARDLGLRVQRISLIGGDGFSGLTEVGHDHGNIPATSDLERRTMVHLAGRVAEREILGRPTIGSMEDLSAATKLIGTLHVSLGMGGSLVHRGASSDVFRILGSDANLRSRVDEHLRRLEDRVTEIVRRRWDGVVELARELRVRRFLAGARLARIFDGMETSDQ